MNAPLLGSKPAAQSRAAKRALPLPFAPALDRRRFQSYLLLMLTDIAVLFGGMLLSGFIYLGEAGIGPAVILAQLVLPLFLTIALYNNAYSMQALSSWRQGAMRSAGSLAMAAAAVVFIAFYTKSSQTFSRVVFTAGVVPTMLLLAIARSEMARAVTAICGEVGQNVLVIEDGGPHVEIDHAIRVSARDHNLDPNSGDPHALNRIGMALRNIDRVLISCLPERRAAWAAVLKGASIAGEVLDQTVAELGALGASERHGAGWLLVSTGPLAMRARIIKRFMDIVLSGLALIALSPLFLVVTLAILLEDGGPVFFIQRRTGLSNRFFEMIKFRSMRTAMADNAGAISTGRDDPRITRVGKFIRRTSIDELPQLVNIFLGDMSVVGPRPHALGSQAGTKLFWEIDERYGHRHALKPGLTGLAQVRGLRGATEVEDDLSGRLKADLEYVNNWTPWRDITIIFGTLRVIVHDRAF